MGLHVDSYLLHTKVIFAAGTLSYPGTTAICEMDVGEKRNHTVK